MFLILSGHALFVRKTIYENSLNSQSLFTCWIVAIDPYDKHTGADIILHSKKGSCYNVAIIVKTVNR